jgi:hypothetical protein
MEKGRSADVVSVVVVLAGFVISLGLAVGAFVASFCGLFGTQCTSGEEELIGLLSFASIGVFLAVPVVVAIVRGQARWLLAPLIEAVTVVVVWAALGWDVSA